MHMPSGSAAGSRATAEPCQDIFGTALVCAIVIAHMLQCVCIYGIKQMLPHLVPLYYSVVVITE